MLTFMSGCLPGRPYREVVEAAGAAGFGAITIWPNVLRHARDREGLSLRDMRRILDDCGLVLADVEGCGHWMPGSPAEVSKGPTRDEMLEACAALGARSLAAIHPPGMPLVLHEAAAGFARLCDDAASLGLSIALEYIATSEVAEIATALRILDLADRPNGGLVIDTWHQNRGKTPSDAGTLDSVAGHRILTIQISDGPLKCDLPPNEETRLHRLLPGEGQMNVVGLLDEIAKKDVAAFWGPEVYQASFEGRDTLEIMRELIAATAAVMPARGIRPVVSDR